MPKFNRKQLAMIALILDDEEKTRNRAKKMWVRKMFTMINSVGEFYTLFEELEDEEIAFCKYFRMLQNQFYILLSKKLKHKFLYLLYTVSVSMYCIFKLLFIYYFNLPTL